MSLPRHPQYKDSGVAWLGKVPAHWQVHRLKNLFEIRKRIVGEEGHQVLSITQRGIKVKDIESNDGQLSMDYSKYQIVHPGDFAMNHMDLLTGFVDISPYAGVTSPDYRVFAVRDGVLCEPRYFLYLLQNAYRQKIFYAFGQGASEFGRWRFPTDQFNDFRFPYPPPGEQTAIATFLDRETGKIDALIAEQEKLLALLAEKRQATISRAVTKGLYPDAPMKDSGVAWLGDVPEHWGVSALSYLATINTGSTPDRGEPSYWNGSIPWIKTGEIAWEPILESEEFITEKALSETAARIAEPGTLMMAMYGQGVTRGRVAILSISASYNQACAAISFGTRVSAEYARYFFMAAYQFIREEGNETSQMNLSSGIIAKIKLPIPLHEEQTAIVSFLDSETTKLDALRIESEHAIALLKERRSALIAAAVTGQIDVRGLVTEPEAA